jgi:hypothetical protein
MTYYEHVIRNFEKYSGKSNYRPINFSLLKFLKIQPIGDTMQKRQLGTLFLVTCLSLITIPAALGAQTTVNPTSGTGAQIEINKAINSVASGATSSNPGYVLLTAGTYKLTGPVILKSNVVLKGAGDSTIIYADSSVCNSNSAPGYIMGTGVSNVEVCNLQFRSSATKIGDGGYGEYRNCIWATSSSNWKIHDILVTPYHYNDGVKILKSTGMQVYNCRIRSGHDGIEFLSDSSGCRAYNNDIDITVNTGIRVDNGKNVELDHNTLYGNHGSGWCVFEMESSLSNINIHHNILHDYRGSSGSAAVQPVHASGSVNFHDNVLWSVGPISMGSGSGNIISPSNKNVANWVAQGYGYGSIGIIPAPTTDSTAPTTNSTTPTTNSTIPATNSTTPTTNSTTPTTPTTNSTDTIAQKSPVAAFSASPISGKAQLTVTFTDKSTGSPTSYRWDFGDGTQNSTTKNPVHKYNKTGKYTVKLKVTNAKGSNSLTKSGYITVK